jgi:hypothetical protein
VIFFLFTADEECNAGEHVEQRVVTQAAIEATLGHVNGQAPIKGVPVVGDGLVGDLFFNFYFYIK